MAAGVDFGPVIARRGEEDVVGRAGFLRHRGRGDGEHRYRGGEAERGAEGRSGHLYSPFQARPGPARPMFQVRRAHIAQPTANIGRASSAHEIASRQPSPVSATTRPTMLTSASSSGTAKIARSGLERPFFRSEEHTSELPSLSRISYAVFCLKKKNTKKK